MSIPVTFIWGSTSPRGVILNRTVVNVQWVKYWQPVHVVIFKVKLSCIMSFEGIKHWLLTWLVKYVALLLVPCQFSCDVIGYETRLHHGLTNRSRRPICSNGVWSMVGIGICTFSKTRWQMPDKCSPPGGGEGHTWNWLSHNQNKAKMFLSFTHNN